MKFLFLSCGTGEGHNSAAHALMEAAQAQGVCCVLADPVSFGSEQAKRAVSALYNNMIKRRPRLFGAVYKAGVLLDKTKLPSPVYFANAIYAKTLGDYLSAGGFDAVVCTHLYGMEAMTALRKRGHGAVPCFGVLTDYTCIPFFRETVLDGYFIPHADLVPELLRKGVPLERIYPLGIPVSRGFRQRPGKAEARRRLEIAENARVYLLMSGGVGCGNVSGLCDALLCAAGEGSTVYVLTGRNTAMARDLQARHGEDPRVRIVPFTEQVSTYMAAADVVLSKPGGLSSTEAAAIRVPLVHYMTIPGCETKNAAFFAAHRMSVKAEGLLDAARQASALAEDPLRAEHMVRMQARHIRQDAAEQIIRQVTQVVHANHNR